MKYIGCVFALLLAVPSMAAVQKKSQAPVSKILSGEGVSFGGLAGTGFTMMDLRLSADNKKKVERIVIDVGDMNGGKIIGWPGYYFAELRKDPSELVIDFSQMPNSLVNQQLLKQKFNSSKAVHAAKMSLDPMDSSLNLTLSLKKNTKVRVYQVAGKKTTSKVVVDLIME
ncbi:hypothetical protein BDW_11635 [Bdellovibrio bacteriovorus W]|nr:hypothetical protein BDW_11635 [Bdellovibrio bacteriovorus W]